MNKKIIDKIDSKPMRAKDLKDASSVSYRQINDWESKGVLPDNRKEKKEWRTYSGKEVFYMMICKEIRDCYGVPLEMFKYIKSMMLQKNANHLRYAIEMIRDYELTVYLLTDLKQTFILDAELEFEDLFKLGFFRGDTTKNYIFMNVVPIVNKLLSLKNIPPLKTSSSLSDSLKSFEADHKTKNANEKMVLALIREKKFKCVTANLKNGEIYTVDTDEDLSEEVQSHPYEKILDVLRNNKYSTFTIKKLDNKIIRLTKKSTRKPSV